MVSKVSELREALVSDLNEEGWEPHHLAAAQKAVDDLIFAVRQEILDSARPCCNASCRNEETPCPGEMELHWVCTRCGHEHHGTSP